MELASAGVFAARCKHGSPLYSLDWVAAPALLATTAAQLLTPVLAETWLVCCSEQQQASAEQFQATMRQELDARGAAHVDLQLPPTHARTGAELQQWVAQRMLASDDKDDTYAVHRVLYLYLPTEHSGALYDEAFGAQGDAILQLLQCCASMGREAPEVHVITANLVHQQDETDTDTEQPATLRADANWQQCWIQGCLRSIRMEHGNLALLHTDLELDVVGSGWRMQMLRQAVRALCDRAAQPVLRAESELLLHADGSYSVPRVMRHAVARKLPASGACLMPVRSDGTYIITGGTGALGEHGDPSCHLGSNHDAHRFRAAVLASPSHAQGTIGTTLCCHA